MVCLVGQKDEQAIQILEYVRSGNPNLCPLNIVPSQLQAYIHFVVHTLPITASLKYPVYQIEKWIDISYSAPSTILLSFRT